MKTEEKLLSAGRNVWCEARANRASVLVDAAEYFGAVRQAMLAARDSIQIVGWDVDSRTELVGPSGYTDDDLPTSLGDFLDALVRRRPHLKVRILLWDYSVFFASEREPLPTIALRWKRLPQIDLCLDDSSPLCAAHHQKIVVIDDNLAFAGGLDLTVRRWDDRCHAYHHDRRIDPSGEHYPPFHDVQVLVDGEAAQRLAELARDRWTAAACEPCPLSFGQPTYWPKSVVPQFRDVMIGIARTMPDGSDMAKPGSDEVEQLFLDMIGSAEHCLYIESQYLTYLPIAQAIAARLKAVPDLEVLLICPRTYLGHFERQAMLSGRAEFLNALEACGQSDRWIAAAPRANDGENCADIVIHSKVTIVDDRYLRVGSANICNRSMGTDTECDIVIIARDHQHKAAITKLRNGLLAEHSGLPQRAVDLRSASRRSLVRLMKQADPRKLVMIDANKDDEAVIFPMAKVLADPRRPLFRNILDVLRPGQWIGSRLPEAAHLVAGAMVLIGLVTLSALWAWSPTLGDGGLRHFEQWISPLGSHWSVLAVIILFLAGGAVAFPLILMVLITTTLFGAWPGLLYAIAGAMVSACLAYVIGRWMGQEPLRKLLGPRLNRISAGLSQHGILAVTAVRLLPIAPFTIVNLAAGALRIPLSDFLIGTLLGFLPGFAVIGIAGQQASELIRNPTPGGVGILAMLLLISIGCSFLLQWSVTAIRGKEAD